MHTEEAQSPPFKQSKPAAHAEQLPPQSTSVSSPFFTVSPQPAVAHLLAVQTPLAQSLPTVQSLPVAQRGHDVPPQSTSVSSPVLT
jgi:hypothetical protein